MQVLYERCCGIDIHKKSLTACLIRSAGAGRAAKEIRTFTTMTADLLRLGDWLAEAECTHIGLESTGVYWKPVWNLFEDRFTLRLANAQHIKAVPGRKSDVKDCEWIADLLRHGLLPASFVPERPQRELRELTRYRTSLVRDRSREVNRLQKTLEGANIKLASVVSEVTGVSARQMLAELIAGNDDVAAIAQLAKGQLRNKIAELEQALTGQFTAHQQFLVIQHLGHIDFLDAQIDQISTQIAERLRPFARSLEVLDSIPGIATWGAEVFLAEVGGDLSRFRSPQHLASWAGLCPGSHESGGKRTSGRTRKGSPWLKVMLTEAAYAAGRSNTRLGERYHRLSARRGRKRATIAIAHQILVLACHLLTHDESYSNVTPADEAERRRLAEERRLIKRLERLGNTVTINRTAA